ncbi:MAG TPA: hypothetical protein DCQ30_00925 [Acidimicrobiaceae bacterium]|nr:hypothetical protein [Acidimicrobiaceae bacterium]
MERLAEMGDEVVVLTADYRMPGVEEMPSKATVLRDLKGWWDWEEWAPAKLGPLERIHRERHNQRTLARVLEDFRPQVASVWDLGMGSWTIATILEERGVPMVLTFLDDWVTFAHIFDAWTRVFDRRPWARPLGRILGLETRLPRFDGALSSAASRMIAEAIHRNGRWKFPNAELIPIGVDTEDFPVSPSERRNWSWRILYVGRVVPQKGVLTLVRALALLPPAARLEIVGHAHESQRVEVEQLAADLGVADRIHFDVASSRQDLRRRYRSTDVLVFPSEWPEPFGLVPLEAMACGVPVVATGTGGSGEFLADGRNCLLFEPGDEQSLAAALRSLAADPELRGRIVAGGTETASEMTMDRFAQRLAQLHHRAAGS